MLASLRQDVVSCMLASAWMAFAPSAFGQSYAQGHAKYLRGDFRGAEKALTAAVKTEAGADRAKSLKLLGICQYMLGDRARAGDSFRQAVKLKPGLAITSSEVLDEDVIAFFQQETKKPTPAPAQTPPQIATKAPTPQVATKASGAKKTLLRVNANVPNASVSMDGILAGIAGDVINAEPGQVEVEVTAKGYLGQRLKVNIAKDRENTITVNLQKPKPKATSVAQKQKAEPKPKKAKGKKPKDDDLFAPVPSDDYAAEPATDPAAEFERETGNYTAGQGGPGVPQGAQLAYTTGGQPVYAIIVPQQAATYTPPPPPAPPGQQYAEGDPYMPPPAMPPDPAAATDPAYSDAPAPTKGASKSNLLITLLPFGAGQFQNGSYVLGGAFLGAETYALYYYYTNLQKVTKATNERNAFVKDKQATGDELTEDEQGYVTRTDNYIRDTKQQIQYAQLGFVGLWAVGVVEALIHERNAPPSAKEKKTRKQRKYGGFSQVVPDEIDVAPVLAQSTAGVDASNWSLSLRWEL